MSIKCLFGKHDWEEVESFSEKSVVNNLLEERFRKYARERINIREFLFNIRHNLILLFN